MIYTLTTNPSIDYYIHLQEPIQKGIHRVQKYSFEPGGKGVNVSKVLANLGLRNVCVLAVGGFSGCFVKQQLEQDEHLLVKVVEIEGNSRINVKVRSAGDEIDLNTSGPALSQQKQQELIEIFSNIEKDDIVCINGTVQDGLMDTLFEIAKRVKKQQAKLVLDVPNMTYQQILQCQSYLIKPNMEELEQLLQLDSSDWMTQVREKLTKQGIACLLSLGEKGSCYIGLDRCLKANCPKVAVVNTVGAGDSLLAGFLYMLANNKPMEQCLKFASASGSGAVTKNELPQKQDIEPLLEQVEVREM